MHHLFCCCVVPTKAWHRVEPGHVTDLLFEALKKCFCHRHALQAKLPTSSTSVTENQHSCASGMKVIYNVLNRSGLLMSRITIKVVHRAIVKVIGIGGT